MFTCGGPCHLSVFTQCSGACRLRGQLVDGHTLCYYLINTVDVFLQNHRGKLTQTKRSRTSEVPECTRTQTWIWTWIWSDSLPASVLLSVSNWISSWTASEEAWQPGLVWLQRWRLIGSDKQETFEASSQLSSRLVSLQLIGPQATRCERMRPNRSTETERESRPDLWSLTARSSGRSSERIRPVSTLSSPPNWTAAALNDTVGHSQLNKT